MKDNFLIMIETWHKPDLGEQDNVSREPTLCRYNLNKQQINIELQEAVRNL